MQKVASLPEEKEISDFLRKLPPFSFLSEEELRMITSKSDIVKFAPGTIIIKEGETIPEYIYVVKDGTLISTKNSTFFGYYSSGDIFPVISPLLGLKAIGTVTVEKKCTCIRIPMKVIKELLKVNKTFNDFFASLFESKIAKIYGRYYGLYRGEFEKISERLLRIGKISDLISRPLVSCPPTLPLEECIDVMNRKNVGSIVVVDGEGKPAGILTVKDILRLLSQKIDLSTPISDVMSRPVISIDANASLYEAYLAHTNVVADHLVVVNSVGKAIGVITSKDLILGMEPSYALTFISGRIGKAESLEELKALNRRIIQAVFSTVAHGVGFYELSEVITEINDRLTIRVIELAIRKLQGEGFDVPDGFVWVTAGSGGRKEQIFRTDQDNAIIFRDDFGEKERLFVEKLSNIVNNSLEAIGIPKCIAGHIASNPQWRASLSKWKEYFDDWISEPYGQKHVYLSLFLDMRPVYGDGTLVNELKSYVYSKINLRALKSIADLVFRVKLPLSFLGRIRYGNGIDIKKVGLLPIVQLVKSLSIKAKIYSETTAERIGELIKKGVLTYEEGSELREAYQFLSIIRLRHQFQQFFEGKPLDNNIVKNELTRFEQQLLKASFQTINNMKQIFIRNFGQPDSVV